MRRRLPKAKERVSYDAQAYGAACRLCPLSKTCKPVAPRIQLGAKLTVVESWPARSEDERGEPTRHPAGELLRKNLAAANVDEYSYTWALLCRVPKGTSKQDVATAIECCAPRLASDVLAGASGEGDGAGERKWLISLGQEAFKATTGKLANLDAWIGAPIDTHWPGVRAVPTWSPGWILKPDGSALAGVFGAHVWRAAFLSDGRLSDWQWPRIIVDEGEELSASLEAIAEYAESGGLVSIDIETRGKGLDSDISCVGFATDSHCVSVQIPMADRDRLAVTRILRNGVGLGQNFANFDRVVLERKGFDMSPNYEDTMLAASLLDPMIPKDLGFLTSSEFHSEAHKAEHKNGKKAEWESTDVEVERARRLYNAKDAYTTLLVWKRQQQRLAEYV